MTDPGSKPTDIAAKAEADVRGVLAQLGPTTDIGRRRRALLPTWIKVFSWMFLILGAGAPAVAIAGWIGGYPVSFELFGFSYAGSILNVDAVLLAMMLAGCGITAYGLLWGRSWGQFAAMTTGWGGLALSIASMFVAPGFRLPLEPFFLVPFMIAMQNRKAAWNEAAGD